VFAVGDGGLKLALLDGVGRKTQSFGPTGKLPPCAHRDEVGRAATTDRRGLINIEGLKTFWGGRGPPPHGPVLEAVLIQEFRP